MNLKISIVSLFLIILSSISFAQIDTISAINPIINYEEENLKEENLIKSIPKPSLPQINCDSLIVEYEYIISQLEETKNEIKELQNNYSLDTIRLNQRIDELMLNAKSLKEINDTLLALNQEYKIKLQEKNNLLEEKIKLLQEKEILFAEKEAIYKEAINSSNIDKVKIEGQLESKNQKIDGKDKEIILLQKNIIEKDDFIKEKNLNIENISKEKEKYYLLADTLRAKLVKTEKELLQLREELKYTKQRAKEAEDKIAAATGRKKKVRVIQGIAMRYPTPVWDIVPRATSSGYENIIINRNSSVVEFDFVTGASIMLYDLTKPDAKFSSDIALYVGFGGANLFKNFYIGGSYRFLDFFHVAVGINVSEYTILAEEFNKEGDALKPGWSIQTTKQWKVTPFISLSLDFEFLSYIGKK